MRFESWARAVPLLVIVASLASCSPSGLPKLEPARGKVSLDGTPLAQASVMFTPVDMATRASTAMTDDQGQFELYFNSDNAGVAVGKYHVTVSKRVYSETNPNDPGKETVPKQYQEYGTIDVDVVSGKNEFDLELKSN